MLVVNLLVFVVSNTVFVCSQLQNLASLCRFTTVRRSWEVTVPSLLRQFVFFLSFRNDEFPERFFAALRGGEWHRGRYLRSPLWWPRRRRFLRSLWHCQDQERFGWTPQALESTFSLLFLTLWCSFYYCILFLFVLLFLLQYVSLYFEYLNCLHSHFTDWCCNICLLWFSGF